MFTLAHLSDPHLAPLPQPRWSELINKRITGYINWRRGRHLIHDPATLDAIVADLKAALVAAVGAPSQPGDPNYNGGLSLNMWATVVDRAGIVVAVVLALAGVEYFERVRDKGYQPAHLPGLVACAAAPVATYNYGLAALGKQAELGAQERAIEQEGITADINQFKEERDYPYKQVQYMQSLLQGLPLQAQSYTYSQPSALSEILSGSGGIMDLYNRIFPGSSDTSTLVNAYINNHRTNPHFAHHSF